jgi:succinyl-diaminopimelate desuccinylase
VGTKVAGPSNIGNYLATLGIEATAGFGVGYRNLHGTDECIELATIPQVQATYHKAILELLGVPSATALSER